MSRNSKRWRCLGPPIAFAVGVFWISGAVGDADTDMIAREAARTAAETEAKDAAKTWGNSVASVHGIGAGTAAIGVVDLAFAANDFANAKDDRGKFHASLKAAASVYVLASGPYAPVVAIAVTVAIAIDDALGARNAAALLEIYREIEESEKRIIELKTQLATVDQLALSQMLSQLEDDVTVTSAARANIGTHCAQSAAISTLSDLNQCIFWLASWIDHARDFTGVCQQILNWQSEYVSPTQVFAAAKTTLKDIKAAQESYAVALKTSDKEQQALLSAYGKMAADIIARRVLDTPTFSTEVYLSDTCIQTASDVDGAAEDFVLQSLDLNRARSTKTSRAAFRLRGNKLLESVRTFATSECKNLPMRSPRAKLVRSWMSHIQETQMLLSAAIAENR